MEKRNVPRLLCLTLDEAVRPYFRFAGKKFTVRALSENGLSLWVPNNKEFSAQCGDMMNGELHIGEEIYNVEVQLQYIEQGQVGGVFFIVPQEAKDKIKHLLQFATQGWKLEGKSLEKEPIGTLGFPSVAVEADGIELQVWYRESTRMIHAMQLCFNGKWIFRSQFNSPQTGTLKSQAHAEVRQKKVNSVDVDPIIDDELLRHAAQLLSSVPNSIPGSLIWQFLETGEQVGLPKDLLNDLSDVA